MSKIQIMLCGPRGKLSFCDLEVEKLGDDWRKTVREAFEEVLSEMPERDMRG